MKYACECYDRDCDLSVEISVETLNRINNRSSCVIIVNECPNGPMPEDKLLEERDEYSIYQMA